MKAKTGEFKNPIDFYIYDFKVEDLRHNNVMNQEVLHEPLYSNPEIEGNPITRLTASSYETPKMKITQKLD